MTRIDSKITFDWVTIPAGEFIMDNEGDSTKPARRKIYLPEYQIARIPVTNEQWNIFLQNSGYDWQSRKELWRDGLPPGLEKHPVVNVSFQCAEAFCKWAGGVRLPTPEEWKKAAQGAVLAGNNPYQPGQTAVVGSYPEGASLYGCWDMVGNVSEWTSEWKDIQETVRVPDYSYDTGYRYATTPIEFDWEEKVISYQGRIVCGGLSLTKISARGANYAYNDLGFRCVRIKPQQSVSQSAPNATAAIPKTKITFDWVTIPAGEFLMGTDPQKDPFIKDDDMGQWIRKSELPQHKIYLGEYQIARVPVTNEQWGEFLQASGYQWKSRDKLWQHGLPRGLEKHPVVFVTWNDALAFCVSAGVSLPTEVEWEKAARGTDGRLFPWGNQPATPSLGNFNKNVGHTTPVATYPHGASPYGCLDMAGNVWEWCSSEYKAYPYNYDEREDLLRNKNRVLRGGSWGDIDPRVIRVCIRGWNHQWDSNEFNGFRCTK